MRLFFFLLLSIFSISAFADTPPLRNVNASIYDFNNVGVSGTTVGGKHGLDEYNINPISAPANIQSIFGGIVIDPRTRQWVLASGTDSVTAFQGGAPWSVSVVGSSPNVNVHDGAGTSITSTLVTGKQGLDVNVVNATSSTVNQGNKGSTAQAWYVQGTDGTNSQSYTASGEAKVDVTTTVLPPLAATSTLQSSGNASLASIDSKLTNPLPVSASSLPLPANAAQETGGHLASIDGKLNSLGQKTMANSVPVAIASDQSSIPVTGTFFQAVQPVSQSGVWTVQQGTPPWSVAQSGAWTTGRTWTLSSGTDSVNVGNFPATFGVTQSTSPWVDNISQFGGNPVVTGTGISGVGIPRMTVASDSSITANAGTNLNTSALNLETTQSAINAKLNSLGQKTAAASMPVVLSSDNNTVTANAGTNLNTSALALDTSVNGLKNPLGTTGAGTAGTQSYQVGAVFNTAAPTLTNSQQSSLQLDSRGGLIVAGSAAVGTAPVNNPVRVSGLDNGGLKRDFLLDTDGTTESNLTKISGTAAAVNYGTAANAMRVAAQIGNASAVADFNSGATGAQTLRVAANSYDGAGNAITSSTFNSKTGQSSIISGQDIKTVTGSGSALNGDAIAATDVSAYSDISLQIIVTGTNTTTFQGSTDLAFTTPFSVNCQSVSSGVTAAIQTTAATIAVHCPKKFPFFRARITAFTSGTSAGNMTLSPHPSPNDLGQRSVNVANTVPVSGSVNQGIQVFSTNTASAARTTSGNSGFVTQAAPNNSTVLTVLVTAVSGTNPTLDMSFGESLDNGASNNTKRYDWDRITTTGQFASGPLQVTSNKPEMSWVIGGTTPSFTFSITMLQGNTYFPLSLRMVDRVLVPTTTATPSGQLNIDGCKTLTGSVYMTTVVGAPTFTIAVSEDGVNFAPIGSLISPTTVALNQSTSVTSMGKFARIQTVTADAASVLNYDTIRCSGN